MLELAALRSAGALLYNGTPEATAEQVRAHLDAGADHVCVQLLDPDPNGLPMAGWRALAPAFWSAEARAAEGSIRRLAARVVASTSITVIRSQAQMRSRQDPEGHFSIGP